MSDSGSGAAKPGSGASSPNPSTIYLDSCFYLDYLKGGTEYDWAIKTILEEWRAGSVEVVTSALTLTEVLWLRCDEGEARMLTDRAFEPAIMDLFAAYPPRRFVLVELDRVIAQSARELVWDKNIKPKDAIHVASAVAAGCEVMFTCDKGLWRHSGQLEGVPTLQVQPPTWVIQASLPMGEALFESTSEALAAQPVPSPIDPESQDPSAPRPHS